MSTKAPSDVLKTAGRKKEVLRKSRLKLKLVTEFPGHPFPDADSGVGLRSVGVISHYPALPIDYDATLYFKWFNEDTDGLVVGSYGEFRKNILSNAISRLSVGSYGVFKTGVLFPPAVSKLGVRSFGDIWAGANKKNWVKWSNIGEADFTIWKDNVAGERPLDWKGWVYAIKRLLNKVVVYGENGVSYLLPVEKYYDLLTIHRLGLKGRNAVAGDDKNHFFVDTAGQLWQLGEIQEPLSGAHPRSSKELLDYSEYLADMGSNVVLSWDAENRLLYICDGIIGYVYSPDDRSLGKGPANVTGISSQGEILHVASPTTIITPVFEICTDIYDMGTHKNKTIFEIEVGTNITGTLQASIDYRDNVKAAFSQTVWRDVSKRGTCFLTALGREFRIRVRINGYEYFELDYIVVKGIIHAH